jgi:excisionase family DNA binding protein
LSRFRGAAGHPEWLALGDASRLLGVAPGTLRRWSDAGRITSITTLGGHRRYRRAALERLLSPDRMARPPLARSGLTATRLAHAYRRQVREATQLMPWLGGLTEEQRSWFRVHGRQLAESLIGHLDATDAALATESLRQASEEAAGYGSMAAGMGLSLSQAVEGFLEFRRPFLHQLGLFSHRRGLDAAETSRLIETAEQAMDRLLMSAMTGHGVRRAGQRRGFDVESEQTP